VRVPLSWLRDFAPFPADAAAIAATLDDLGLVVEGIERTGEGLDDVVLARVEEITAIEGADKIRRVVVDAGADPVEVACGATNFAVGDLVPLAPVGAVLPGGFTIGRRKMRGMVSNGMLCSGRELHLGDDHAGLLVLNDCTALPGTPLTEALGIEPDVVFDVAVEANRPDAWCMAGVARDLAARLGLAFAIPSTVELLAHVAPTSSSAALASATGPAVATVASVQVDDLELCPRFTVRVLTGVTVGESPEWLARRLVAAGMRPINNVVDASNYVMLELGQPTHPYDLDKLAGDGLLVRRAGAGESVTTLDGVARTLGKPGPGLGDSGQDCLICDTTGTPVGIGGIMGGASSDIGPGTTRVLLEAAYFVPMAIARTSKRLNLRTEASARFERGCDPAGIDRAAERFCELVALTGGPDLTLAEGVLDVVGEVPQPLEIVVRPFRINGLLGTELTASAIAELLVPLGVEATPRGGDDDPLDVVVPTFRPDIRPAPIGETDLAEEVARTFGYSALPRRHPAWPQPGRLTDFQRERRRIKDVLCGLGVSEAWTTAFVTRHDQLASGFAPPYVEVTNPLVESERYLRSSMAPGLVRAVVYNAERRQGEVRLFEVGSVFRSAAIPSEDGPGADVDERLCAVFATDGDDAWSAVAAWRTVADALGLVGWEMEQGPRSSTGARVTHDYRSAVLTCRSADGEGARVVLGEVGELDPTFVETFGLIGPDGRPRRVGWLDLDLAAVLDPGVAPRRPSASVPVSRFPSSDIDLAFVVPDEVPAGAVEATLVSTGGELIESVQLFDVYRGESVGVGTRSLAYRLRFCAFDRTLTDEEIGTLRAGCITAVEGAHRATLRGTGA